MNIFAEYFYLFLFHIFSFILKFIPNKIIRIFSILLAKIFFIFNKKHKNIILKNIEYFCKLAKQPQSNQIAKKIYEKFIYYIFLIIKNQKINEKQLLKQIKLFKNDEEFKELLAKKEKIVFTTAHFGNWELLPPAAGLKYNVELSVVGRALKSKKMNEYLVKNRKKFNVGFIDKKNALRKMLKDINNNKLIGIVSDQDASIKESSEFLLYGNKVTQSNAASVIAKRVNAYIVPVYIYEFNGGFCIEFLKAINAKDYSIEELSFYQLECTKKMWEKHISEYFWFHKRFKTFYEDLY